MKEDAKICRVVMRCPNRDIRKYLELLHRKINEFFINISDESIEWMLSANSETARGGFNNGGTVQPAQKFRVFFSTDPQTISSQALITRISTVCAAIGMSSIKSQPDGSLSFVFDRITTLMKDTIVSRISEVYPKNDDVTETMAQDIDIEPNNISDASDVDQEEKQPQQKTPARHYSRNSWVGRAYMQAIPVRAHVSGTAPLVLAAIDALFLSGSNPDRWFRQDENAIKFAATLIVAHFHRGDFHSIAESACGVNHFIAKRSGIASMPLDPNIAYTMGLDMLKLAISEVSERNEFSFFAPSKLKEPILDIQLGDRLCLE